MWASFLAVACVFCLFMSMIYQVNDMRLQRDRERIRADEATNRLLAAWRDGYHIPEPAPEPFVEEPLPPALAEWLSQWEDPAARERFEADIRRKLAQGRTPDQLLMDLEVSS
jgi:hypothetical protein